MLLCFFNRNQKHSDLLKTRHFRHFDHGNLEGQDGMFRAGFNVKYLNIDCTCGTHLVELQPSSVDIFVGFGCPLCLQAMERRGDESSHPGAVFQTWSQVWIVPSKGTFLSQECGMGVDTTDVWNLKSYILSWIPKSRHHPVNILL